MDTKTQLRDSKGRFLKLSKNGANYFTVEVTPRIVVRDAMGRFMSYNTIDKTFVRHWGETSAKVRNIKSNRNPSVEIEGDNYHYVNANIRVNSAE